MELVQYLPRTPPGCKKLATPSPIDRNPKHEDTMSDLQKNIERAIRDHGRMVIGVFPDKESPDPLNARFCYTIARAHAADRCADGLSRERSGRTGVLRRISGGTS